MSEIKPKMVDGEAVCSRGCYRFNIDSDDDDDGVNSPEECGMVIGEGEPCFPYYRSQLAAERKRADGADAELKNYTSGMGTASGTPPAWPHRGRAMSNHKNPDGGTWTPVEAYDHGNRSPGWTKALRDYAEHLENVVRHMAEEHYYCPPAMSGNDCDSPDRVGVCGDCWARATLTPPGDDNA